MVVEKKSMLHMLSIVVVDYCLSISVCVRWNIVELHAINLEKYTSIVKA